MEGQETVIEKRQGGSHRVGVAAIATAKFLKAAFLYIVFFRWVIDLVRWLLDVGGTIAESAFLLATTYVIINLVAHKLVLWMVFGDTNVIDSLNQIAMIAFSVLPELIAISAIKKSYEMWILSFGTKRVECFVWAVLFTLPTLVFLYMTIRTINGFVSLESAGQSYSLTGDDLRWRVVSGFVYGVSQKLFAEIGKGTLDKIFIDLKHQLHVATTTLTNRENTINGLQTTITDLQNTMGTLQSDLVALRIAQAQKHTHTRKTAAPEHDHKPTENTHTETHTHTSGSSQSASQKRQKLKELMSQTVISGKPLNIKKLSADAGVSYNTGLRHKDTIIEEITREHPTLQLVREA